MTRYEDEELDRLFTLMAQKAVGQNIQSEAAGTTAVRVCNNWPQEIENDQN